ncbi:MAG: ribosome small subunit-dependent GTPase A [Clostridiales bacterium]|nr:ribosome small subunit-dependent GTPase A [Clostridiales bacterium]
MPIETGILTRSVGGFCDVWAGGALTRCLPRGVFRKRGEKPLPGDLVRFVRQTNGHAFLTEILPRKNELLRPAVSNVDAVFLIFSASLPRPDYALLDRLLVQAAMRGIEPILVLNKMDEANAAHVAEFMADYAAFAPLCVSAKAGEGLDALKPLLANRVCCFAGQSAVGKSSLLNALFGWHLETGELSARGEVGKHTTRRAELLPALGGYVCDTPGFALLELPAPEQALIDRAYPEFAEAPPCRFSDCSHRSEPDCNVRPLLAAGTLTEGRYSRYIALWNELQERKRKEYD